MENRIALLKTQLISELSNVTNLEEIKQIRSVYNTKSDILNELKEKVKEASLEDKATFGKLINLYNSEIISLINEKETNLQFSFEIVERENVLLSTKIALLKTTNNGELHPLTKTKILVDSFLQKIGFTQLNGNEVEIEKYNFDILNIPITHQSRSKSDTFYLNKNRLLRTHCTNTTSRDLESSNEINRRAYSIGYVFRNDDDDPRHSFQFNQIDLYAIGEETSIATLKWVIDNLLKEIFGTNSKTRYRTSYFPFTEPSFEVDVTCPSCEGNGCSTCSKTGLLEILGCGMLNPMVIKNAGKNPEQIRGFAAGIGLERIAMIKGKVSDIRNFYLNDLNFLKDKTQWNF